MPYLGVRPADITSATEAEIAGDLTVDTNTLKVDAAGNRVMIGTTTEGSAGADELTVGSTSGSNGITIRGGTTGTSSIYMSDATSGAGEYAGYIAYSHNSDSMAIAAAGGQRIRIDADGLKFGSDTAAANALDDYEEGSWTPTYGGSSSNPTVTLDFQTGSYVKIGKIVIASFTIGTDATSGGSGSLLVNGLPFPSMSGRDFISGPALAFSFSSTISDMAMGTSSNTTAIILYQNNNSASTYSTGMLATGANKNRLSGTVIYEVS